jgi:tetratricopeptide (TPR) repeat protein
MYYNRGKTWYELGYIDKALADFEDAIKLTPSFVQSYYALSEHFLSKREETNALKWMNVLLMRYPDLANAHNLRGWIYFNFNRTHLAFSDFDKAITLDSLNASAYNNRGSARYQLQDIESASTSDLLLAKADFMKALTLDSTLANLHRNLGFIEFSLGHYPVADSLLHVAEMRNPTDAMVYYYHGMLYAKTNRTDAAIVEMDKALKQYANLGIAWLAKGQLQFDKRRYGAAIESFNAAAKAEPTLEAAASFQLARTYAAQFERELMLEQLKQADKLGYFGKLTNKQTFFKDPIFRNYDKWGPYKAFEKKIRGI